MPCNMLFYYLVFCPFYAQLFCFITSIYLFWYYEYLDQKKVQKRELSEMNSLTRVGSFVNQSLQFGGCGFQQVRNKWADWKMIRDVKRRKCVVENAKDRLRVNALRKNDILPIELREVADAEIAAFPRDSSLVRVRERCALTSRPRGVVHKYRLSRIVWRHLADYNKLSGVQRAMW